MMREEFREQFTAYCMKECQERLVKKQTGAAAIMEIVHV